LVFRLNFGIDLCSVRKFKPKHRRVASLTVSQHSIDNTQWRTHPTQDENTEKKTDNRNAIIFTARCYV